MRVSNASLGPKARCCAWLSLAALLCLPLLDAAHPFLYYANHARRGYGRNIQPLPCATKRGDTGVCMFAWDCMKAEGTHLGTCIERFYFGSCCKLKPGSKKPEHTVMKTDVYVLATTSPPQTDSTDLASSSSPQISSNLLGMITGQTTLTSEPSDTSTSRTTLQEIGDTEETLSTVQEVQHVFGAGSLQTGAQPGSSLDLDMEAIEQQMVEESGVQGIDGSDDDKINLILASEDSQTDVGDGIQMNEGNLLTSGEETTSGQTLDVSMGMPTTAEQGLSETVPPQTQEPTISTVGTALVTEKPPATIDEGEGQADENKLTGDEQLISAQDLDETQINQDQNEIDGEQQFGVLGNESNNEENTPQVSGADESGDKITPELLNQVLEIESESSQDLGPDVIGVGTGTVTSVELDYTSSATEAYTEQSEESQGQTGTEIEINSDTTGDEASDGSSATSDIQRTTVSQTTDSDSTQELSNSEDTVAETGSSVESSTAADRITSVASSGEQSDVTEVTESSNQTTDPEESETSHTTEATSSTVDENAAQGASSEQIDSDSADVTERIEVTTAAFEKPEGQDEQDEIDVQSSEPSDSTKSSEVSDEVNLIQDSTTVAPQQTDSTVLPQSGDSQSSSDSVAISTPEDVSSGDSSERPSTVADSVTGGTDSEATTTRGEEDAEGQNDALAPVTETISSETGSSPAGTTAVDSGAGEEDDVTSDSESETQDSSDADTGNENATSTPDSGATSEDSTTPDALASESGSSAETGMMGEEETGTPTKDEGPATVPPSDSSEQDTSTSLPSLGENIIVPGVQIVPAPGSVKNESVAVSEAAESSDGDASSGSAEDLTTEIPQQSYSTEIPSTSSTSEEESSTDKSPVEETTVPQSSSSEVSKPDESGSVTVATEAALPNTTAQPEQQFETQEEQLLHRLKTSSFREICGQPVYPSRRIVGGSQASFGEWPWQVSLRQWRSVTYLHKCGAALVNENWAITAAHCVENVLPDQLLLRLGEFDLERADEPYGHVERKVQIIATHPQFDPRTFEYDLALLRFNEPVTFQPNIIPICIPDDDYDFIGDTGYVSGWGRLYEDGPLPSLMQKVPVPVITNGECEVMYRNAGYIEDIPNIFICAGYEGGKRDSCEGDSGGPLVIQHQKSWKLAGVISWGIGCALPNQPGVYTRISAFREWINKIIVF